MSETYFGLEKNLYKDLLKCNFNGIESFDDFLLQKEIEIYKKSIERWQNYGQVDSLNNWYNSQYIYPIMQNHHEKIVKKTKELGVKAICEVGAGAGSVSKYVYAYNDGNIDLTCVEGGDKHIAQMKENFTKESTIITPQMEVNANIVKSIAQNLPFDDNHFDLIYTCTVIMHIPFLLLPKVFYDISKKSKKYIIHVENKNDKINCVCMGNQKSDLNRLTVDYKSVYKKLNYNCIEYYDYKDENVDCQYSFYLGEKIT